MDFYSLNYFGFSAPALRVFGANVWLWIAFNRNMASDDDYSNESAAVGILRVNHRSLFSVQREWRHGVCVWTVDVLFMQFRWRIGGAP